MSVEALIFDVDGTLADTEEAHRCAFNLAFEHFGLGWHQLALRRLGPETVRAVAFEDSDHGLRSAGAAGLWTAMTPTFWTEGCDFSAAGLLLPRLGDPAVPLEGEPGGQLRMAAWLSFSELLELAGPPLPPHSALEQPTP